MSLCQECGFENTGGHSFCINCGKSLIQNLDKTLESNVGTPEPETASLLTPSPVAPGAGPQSKRPLGVVLVVLLVVGGGIGVFQGYQGWNEARLERLAQESLSEAFSDEVLESAVVNCTDIRNTVEGIPEQQIAASASSLEGVTDPREAYARANQADFPSQDYTPGYQRDVEAKVNVGLTALYRANDRDDIAPTSQLSRWEDQWFVYAMDTCKASEQYNSNVLLLAQSDQEFDRVRAMAANAPWYPEEFSEYSTNLAYRWSTTEGGWPCSGCSFWKITVITKTGCPSGLYGQINILRGGVAIDWTNDLISYLGRGDTAQLTFTHYPYRSTLQGQLVELSCY